MVPSTIALLHTLHIYARPIARTAPFKTTSPITMTAWEPEVTWPTILKARSRHQEVKLLLAEVAKAQKCATSLQEYMSYEKKFLDLIERDDALRAHISRMIVRYMAQRRDTFNK